MNLKNIKFLKMISVFSILCFIFLFTQNCSQHRFKDLPIIQNLNNSESSSQFINQISQKNLSVTYPGKSYRFTVGVEIENTKPYVSKSNDTSTVNFSILETLPKGILLNLSTGELYGTPEEIYASHNYTIQAREDDNLSNINFNIEVVSNTSLLTYQIGNIDYLVSTNTTFEYKPKILKPDNYTSPIYYVGNHDALPKGFSLNSSTGIIKSEAPYELFSSKLFNICVANSATESALVDSATIGSNCTPITIKLRDDSDFSKPDDIPLDKEISSLAVTNLYKFDQRLNSAQTSIRLRNFPDLSFVNKNIITSHSTTFSGKTVCDIPNDATLGVENLVKANGICFRETPTSCTDQYFLDITGDASLQDQVPLCNYTHSLTDDKYGYYELCNGKQSELKDLYTTIESNKLSSCVDVPDLILNISDTVSTINGSTAITINCNEANQKLKLNLTNSVSSCEQFVSCDASAKYATTFGSFSCFNSSFITTDGKTNLIATVVDNNNLEIPYYGASNTLRLIPATSPPPPPPKTCTNGAANYPLCTTSISGVCLNGSLLPPECPLAPTYTITTIGSYSPSLLVSLKCGIPGQKIKITYFYSKTKFNKNCDQLVICDASLKYSTTLSTFSCFSVSDSDLTTSTYSFIQAAEINDVGAIIKAISTNIYPK